MIGTKLAVRLGNKLIVAIGLGMMSIAFAWISTASTATTYLEISLQMVVAGIGIGFTSAPATEAIMGVVSKDKAGIGSAVNDATREVGGTLGVAVIGSVFASLYASSFDGAAVSKVLPPEALSTARESIGAAQAVAERANTLAGPGIANQILDVANQGFFDGLAAGCLVAAGVTLFGCIFAAIFLPARPNREPVDLSDDRGRLAHPRRSAPMSQMIVQYKVKPEQVERNEALVRAVYAELATVQPAGLRYATFRLDDGVSFLHIVETEDGTDPLPEIAAFRAFVENIGDRLDEGPVPTKVSEIGTYRFLDS